MDQESGEAQAWHRLTDRYVMRVAVVLYLLECAWSLSVAPLDDAFITLRYARNWLDGHGLVFNPGAQVEGYTNFLWLVLVSVGGRLGIELITFAQFLGCVSGLILLAVVSRSARRLREDLPGNARAASFSRWTPIWVGAFLPLAYHALGGLETALFALVLALMVDVLLNKRFSLQVAAVLLGFLGATCTLLRPDGLLAAVWLLFRRLTAPTAPPPPLRTRLLAWVSGFGVLFVPLLIHLAWRQGFYGELLPNTWRVKEGPLSLTLPLGIHYVASFIRSYGLVFLPILVAIGALRIRQPGLRHHYLSLLGLVAGFSCYVAMMGGDHFAFYRFLVPLWAPSMLLLATCGDALLLDRSPRNSWLIQPMSLVFASYVLWPPAGELRHASEARDNVDRWAFVGQELRKEVPRETVIALSPVGALPYYSRLKTLDILGLTDKHIASLPPDPSIGYVGHLKHDGCYVLRAQPDLLLLDNVRLADGPVSRFPLEGLSPMERDIPTCPEFQQYQLINKPLIGARFPGDFGVVYLVAYARRGSPLAREFGAEDDRPAGTP